MITSIGKLLVFANLVVAIGMVTWAAGLYTNRPPWFAYTDAGGEPNPGQFAELKAEIERLGGTAAAEAARWDAGYKALVVREGVRQRRADRFDAYLALARNSDPANKKADPARNAADPTAAFFRFPATSAGSALLDLSQPPEVESGPDGKPLRSTEPLLAEITANSGSVAAAVAESYELQSEFSALTDQVLAADAALGKHTDLLAHLRNEVEYLKAARINWVSQRATLDRRKAQLDGRLRELDGKAAGR